MTKNLKISYCITCKGRLQHLKETLPKNLANASDYPNTEFVVLDYDSSDGLEAWIKDNYSKEIASGKIRYAKYEPAPHFNMPHAKNMAHRVATGDVLCNLDADNIIAKGFSSWMNQHFLEDPNIYVGSKRRVHTFKKILGQNMEGIGGRIAMTREKFETLNGYDEAYSHGRGDDDNMKQRASQKGMQAAAIPFNLIGQVLGHSDDERVEHLNSEDKQRAINEISVRRGPMGYARRLKNLAIPKQQEILPHPGDNYGCGKVRINFGEYVELGPTDEVHEEVAPQVASTALRDKYAGRADNMMAK